MKMTVMFLNPWVLSKNSASHCSMIFDQQVLETRWTRVCQGRYATLSYMIAQVSSTMSRWGEGGVTQTSMFSTGATLIIRSLKSSNQVKCAESNCCLSWFVVGFDKNFKATQKKLVFFFSSLPHPHYLCHWIPLRQLNGGSPLTICDL